MRAITAVLLAAVAILTAVVVYSFARTTLQTVEIALADEQTEIFADMVAQAADSLAKSPPDVAAAVGYLEYAHKYYPSGTKQTVGSPLDRIVERTRSLAVMQIIDMLREATGVDHGDDPDVWVEAFDERSLAQQRPAAEPPLRGERRDGGSIQVPSVE